MEGTREVRLEGLRNEKERMRAVATESKRHRYKGEKRGRRKRIK